MSCTLSMGRSVRVPEAGDSSENSNPPQPLSCPVMLRRRSVSRFGDAALMNFPSSQSLPSRGLCDSEQMYRPKISLRFLS